MKFKLTLCTEIGSEQSNNKLASFAEQVEHSQISMMFLHALYVLNSPSFSISLLLLSYSLIKIHFLQSY